MTQLFKNAARSALAAPIAAADTSLTVDITTADLFPAANTDTNPVPTVGKDWFKVVLEDVNHNIEIVYVRTRTLGSAVMSNLLRGQEGTTAISFASGSVVGLRMTASDLQGAIDLASSATNPGKDLLTAVNVDTQVQKLGGALQKQLVTAFTTAGTATAYTITPTPAITAYAANLSFDVTFNQTCGLNPTLAISGLLTPPNLVKQLADGTYANLAAGDVVANHRSIVTLLSPTQALVLKLPVVPKATTADTATSATTQPADTNNTTIATTAFVIGQAGSSNPLAAAITAVVGTSPRYSHQDHVHPEPVINSQTFTTTGVNTWTKPTAGRFAIVELWGAGGAGAGSTGAGSGGGGGGNYIRKIFPLSTLGTTETVTVGTGGTGSVGAGNPGGNTTFGTWLTAHGGSGGNVNASGDGGGGGGGLIGSNANAIYGRYGGGNNGTFSGSEWGAGGGGNTSGGLQNGGVALFGGGGGGGSTGTGGNSVYGGNGGAGSANAGTAGTQPGGGGGGSAGGFAGASGGNGKCVVTVY